ncbi:hypothetical protein FisN_1Lu509 [Fistulifera solaris]|uniref:Uncharacterized protein n=1 Tax=Fistulifera solaris TaxID=1519565 RepID=A0A1Z5K187_FISSO|nr:hypothetical protein FisN_1Lu509 [Fistulifera solaris]|eukprot:GAX20017.1 hypothetical protein FisN_1Lu509 [Fistulifera solaris]
MHPPSFFVGSLVAGVSFLMVDEQISHRTRLSKKWAFREFGEEQLKALAEQIRSSRGSTRQVRRPGVARSLRDE